MRDHHIAARITAMPDGELSATRWDLATGIALMRPQSPLYHLAAAYLSTLDAEVARRQGTSASTTTGPPEAPRMKNAWETTVRTAAATMLRYPDKISDGLEAELYALLEQLSTPGTGQPETTGHPGDAP